MPATINNGLADASNVFLVTTVVFYAFAMLAYAGEFAFRKVIVAEPESSQVPELVAAGTAAGAAGVAGQATPRGVTPGDRAEGGPGAADAAGGDGSPEAPGLWPVGRWLRWGFVLTCAGLVTHIASILTRGIAEHRVPWGNMFEFIAAITCMTVVVLVAAAVRFRAYYIGLFVLIPVVLSLAVDVTVVYTPAGSLVPALNSYWIAIHVTAMIVASGLFIVGAVITVMYLIADRTERRALAGLPSGTAGLMMHLPGTTVLDRLSYRAILFAFPVWTFGIMAGAIWADHAWGRYWGWDPKETWSFITWVIYAGFLHARATGGWRGRRAAYIQLVGFGALMFNLVGINLWVTGLHSYAGISG
jgi:cytochrome c-type biogenesis protein CcsB